jgi:hypothetical protein
VNQLENKIQQLELSLNDASNLVNQKDLEIESLTRTSDKLKDEYNSKKLDLSFAEVVFFCCFILYSFCFLGKN